MSESIYTHYTYLLLDENHKKYGGVRSCKEITPEKDPYMGSSDYVCEAMDNGLIFTKHIIKTFDTREEATQYESDWLVRVGAAQSDDWYNQTNAYPKFHRQGMKATEEHIRKVKEALAKKTPEEMVEWQRKRIESMKRNKANRTPEQKAECGRKQSEALAKKTPEEKAESKRKEMETKANKSPEEKAERLETFRRTMANKTPEQEAERQRKRLEAYKRTIAKRKGTV